MRSRTVARPQQCCTRCAAKLKRKLPISMARSRISQKPSNSCRTIPTRMRVEAMRGGSRETRRARTRTSRTQAASRRHQGTSKAWDAPAKDHSETLQRARGGDDASTRDNLGLRREDGASVTLCTIVDTRWSRRCTSRLPSLRRVYSPTSIASQNSIPRGVLKGRFEMDILRLAVVFYKGSDTVEKLGFHLRAASRGIRNVASRSAIADSASNRVIVPDASRSTLAS
jgi:hypothetical protein